LTKNEEYFDLFAHAFSSLSINRGESVGVKNLCLEGGGVKGLGLVGAALYLEEKGLWNEIENFVGSSAGSIFALIAALGYRPKEIKDLMFEVDFSKFKDDESYYRQCKNMLTYYGIHSGKYFELFIKNIIKEKTGKTNTTFKELLEYSDKGLFIITSNISTGFSQDFCAANSPDLELWKAVRMSMAIPYFYAQYFQKVKITNDLGQEENKECIFSDGGVFNNYPIRYFDDPRFCFPDSNGFYVNNETIGFKLETKDKSDILLNKKQPYHKKIRNVVTYTEELIRSLMNNQDNYFRTEDDWKRTIFIDTLGISTTDFSLTLKQKNDLLTSGYNGAKKFFEEKTK
jgi:NTE family protein